MTPFFWGGGYHGGMARITALSPVRGRGDGVVVKVDGRKVATVGQRSVAELRLEVDREWDGALAERVAAAETFDRAYADALRRLNRRALSRGRLQGRLVQAGHGGQVVDRVLDRLEALKLLDDEALGLELIRQTQAAKPAGPRLLRAKLRQQGLADALVDRLLRETAPDAGQAVRDAGELAASKARSMARLDPAVRRRRLWGALARRGFDADTIEAALQEVREVEAWGE